MTLLALRGSLFPASDEFTMMLTFSPRTLISIGALGCLLVAIAVINLAINLPTTDIDFNVSSEGKLFMQPDATGRNANLPSGEVVALVTAGKHMLANSDWVIEEPDVLPDYTRLNQLFAEQRVLANATTLEVVTSDGSHHLIVLAERHWNQLPALFWLQLMFGIGGAMTGILVWSSRRLSLSAGLYALTGIGYLIFAPAAAVYSTRELILDGDLFRLLSAVNHFGALLFTASLTALLSQYPRSLLSFKSTMLIFALAALIWLADYQQWHSPMIFHFGVLGVFAASFVFAVWQWRATKEDPIGRAALRWFLLSIYLATGLFACFIILPAALQLPQPAPQGVMFGAFLLMYWGLALGIVRYRLFDLNHWWHAVMTWFLGGVCVLMLDVTLILFLAMPADLALSLSVAISGWLYFPVRQFIWNRWGKLNALDTDSWLPEILPLLLRNKDIDSEHWRTVSQTLWHAATAEICSGHQANACITDDGMSLILPDFDERSSQHIKLSGAEHGSRLFGKRDLSCWQNLLSIAQLSCDIHHAEKKGADIERQRIRRDIHDDIGARLLTLLHSVHETHQPLIRETLSATRALVNTLSKKQTPWYEAHAQWKAEIHTRVSAAQQSLAWHEELSTNLLMDARTFTNLTRIIREAISNALRHGSGGQLVVSFQLKNDHVRILIENTVDRTTDNDGGSGMKIMTERANEIGANLHEQTNDGIHVLEITLRLEPASPEAIPLNRATDG
ncbi:MAG TPA: hypothetical protein VIC08_03950 [Cellvibrionaceae bacterium]